MDFKPITRPIKIIFFPSLEDEQNKKKNGEIIPDSARCLIIGGAGVGKTNLLLNLLIDPAGLSFTKVYLYSKTLEQKKYKFLDEVINGIDGVTFETFSSNDEVIDPENIEEDAILIIDDASLENQNIIKKHFTVARHKKTSIFYIAHTYSLISKQIIRDNANMIILFPMDLCNLKHVWSDHCYSDFDFQTFQKMCNKVWKEKKYNFLVIFCEKKACEGKYCKNFHDHIILN